jgi:pilus assembly protein CpaC
LDNETTEGLSKIPGLSSIPIFGKLFQSRSITKSNSELLVIVTPELVRPVPAGQAAPSLKYPKPFMTSNSGFPMTQPGPDKTGPVPVHPPFPSMPIELLTQPVRPLGQPGMPMTPQAQPGLPPGTGQEPNSTPAGGVKTPAGGQ